MPSSIISLLEAEKERAHNVLHLTVSTFEHLQILAVVYTIPALGQVRGFQRRGNIKEGRQQYLRFRRHVSPYSSP